LEVANLGIAEFLKVRFASEAVNPNPWLCRQWSRLNKGQFRQTDIFELFSRKKFRFFSLPELTPVYGFVPFSDRDRPVVSPYKISHWQPAMLAQPGATG
jgi:hypothetical protein